MSTKHILILCLSGLLALSCGEKTSGGSPSEAVKALSSYGVALQPYTLTGYERVGEDTMTNTGGRWVSLHYKAATGTSPDPKDVRRRITDALVKEGWSPEPLPPERKYVLSKLWETDAKDLYYRHGPADGDPANLFYNQAVHISDDGQTVACYYEVGW